jgi:hypothetical protein
MKKHELCHVLHLYGPADLRREVGNSCAVPNDSADNI